MPLLDTWLGSDQFDVLETKTNAAITKINDIKANLEPLTAGQVPRQIDGTDFNFVGVFVPTLKVGEAAREKIRLSIGDWNMAFNGDVNVAHGLTALQWKTICIIGVIIRNDLDDTYRMINKINEDFINSSVSGGGSVMEINSTNIRLGRILNGTFDNSGYNSTSYNRGFIDIEYTP